MQKLEKGMACKNHHQEVRHFLFQKKVPFLLHLASLLHPRFRIFVTTVISSRGVWVRFGQQTAIV